MFKRGEYLFSYVMSLYLLTEVIIYFEINNVMIGRKKGFLVKKLMKVYSSSLILESIFGFFSDYFILRWVLN